MASKSARTLSFFFILFAALEFTGEEIIHHQRGNERGNAKILLRVVVQDAKIELIAAIDQPCEKLVHPKLLLVSPLTDRVQEPSSAAPQISAGSNPSRPGRRGEKLAQV